MSARRDLLRAGGRAAVLVAAGGLLGACGPRRAAQAAAVWSGPERARFQAALRGFDRPVEVLGARNDIDAFVRARRGANQPDVVVLPTVGLVADYAAKGWIEPVSGLPAGRFAPEWTQRLTVSGADHGVWVKAAHKSLFWYAPELFDGLVPGDWAGFVDLVRRLSRMDGPAPLAIGAADGWVLTDWLENLLAMTAPGAAYQRLVDAVDDWRGPAVARALDLLAELWSVPGAIAGGGRRALLTQWEESVIQVAARGQARIVFEGDFVGPVARTFRRPGTPPLDTFRFPPLAAGSAPPLLVAGDAAVALSGSPYGPDLVRYLSRPEPFEGWAGTGGYLSPNLGIPLPAFGARLGSTRADAVRSLAAAIRRPGDTFRFDLSDQVHGAFGGPDGLGMWRVMQDFFAEVTDGRGDLAGAVRRAGRRLADEAARARP